MFLSHHVLAICLSNYIYLLSFQLGHYFSKYVSCFFVTRTVLFRPCFFLIWLLIDLFLLVKYSKTGCHPKNIHEHVVDLARFSFCLPPGKREFVWVRWMVYFTSTFFYQFMWSKSAAQSFRIILIWFRWKNIYFH